MKSCKFSRMNKTIIDLIEALRDDIDIQVYSDPAIDAFLEDRWLDVKLTGPDDVIDKIDSLLND